MELLSLREEGELAHRYRRWASWLQHIAWGLAGFFVIAFGATLYGHWINRIPIRVDVIVVAVGFFASPALAAWWLYEILQRTALVHSNRALRLQIKLMQAKFDRSVAAQCPDDKCSHCRSLKALTLLQHQPLQIKANES
jgi:hypothetical protein